MADVNKLYACIDYEGPYVQHLLLVALKGRLPPELLVLIEDASELPTPSNKLLQWRDYESIDFQHLTQHPTSSLANSYIIRKALNRKHYLSTTVRHWLSQHPDSLLRYHVKPTVELEIDYAEFLDDALVEAWELKESWARNIGLEPVEREWWILKPGMSDRGQGVRLFSSKAELRSIFEEWNPESDGDKEEEEEEEEDDDDDDDFVDPAKEFVEEETKANGPENDLVASRLRHFVVQPYIHPPLLLSSPHPFAGRKFHIRTYVLAANALKVFVYRRLLALFAGQLYIAPGDSSNGDLSSHLTNTCLQSGEREGNVHEFWSLRPDLPSISSTAWKDWKVAVFDQICKITGEIFEAAAGSMSIHFQPLPNAFELFGIDFLVDSNGTAWLLEVNAVPDFAQAGEELLGLVAELFEDVADIAIKPFFGLEQSATENENMVQVLDVDLGRR